MYLALKPQIGNFSLAGFIVHNKSNRLSIKTHSFYHQRPAA
jgi:hypothetical protein